MLRGAFDRRMLRRSLLPRKLHDSVPARSRSARGASAFQWRPPGLPALRGPEPRVQRPLPVHRRGERDGQHAGMGVRAPRLRILPAGSPRVRRASWRAAAPFHGARRPSPSSPQEDQLTPRSAVACALRVRVRLPVECPRQVQPSRCAGGPTQASAVRFLRGGRYSNRGPLQRTGIPMRRVLTGAAYFGLFTLMATLAVAQAAARLVCRKCGFDPP